MLISTAVLVPDIAWDEEALPLLIKSLDTFSPIYVPNSPPAPEPSYPSVPSFATSRPDLRYSLLNADVTVLQEVSMLVEALTAEEERVRALLLISTGKSASVSSPDSPFVHLLRFVESGGPLPYWSQGHAELRERAGWEKALGMCKAAVIKAIVTIAGEESQMDVLWGQNDPSGGWFIEQMSRWIKEYPASRNQRTSEERDDLVICATLSLGNLSRGGTFMLVLSSCALACNLISPFYRAPVCSYPTVPPQYRLSACTAARTLCGHQTEARHSRSVQKPGSSTVFARDAGSIGPR